MSAAIETNYARRQKESWEKARGRLCADFLRKGRDAAFPLRAGQLLQ